MLHYEIKVIGKVQGVGFRYFARQKATEFNIAGWVRNTVNHDVLIVAEGEKADLDTFADWIKAGPPLARVDKIIVDKFPGITGFKSFEIKF